MEWTQERIEALLLKVEESQRLDYKNGLFLKNNCQDALTKQITGFANSDGGTLIIGVAEGQGAQKHLAIGFAPCDGIEWSKERVEALIDANISPRIPGITVHPIRIDGDIQRSVYVIDIPKSDTCHQASDARYYFRLNFATEPMRDFQIRDVMNRRKSTNLRVALKVFNESILEIYVKNLGSMVAGRFSLKLLFPSDSFSIEKEILSDDLQIYGIRYLGQQEAKIDFAEIDRTIVDRFKWSESHAFEYDFDSNSSKALPYPRTQIKIGEVYFDHFDAGKFAAMWLIDSDDGKRTYGLLGKGFTSFHEYLPIAVEGTDFTEI